MPNQRDIYLAPFPFSDEDTEKKRPVLVISNSVFNARGGDVLVMAITSNLHASVEGIEISRNDVDGGTLAVASLIVPSKLYSVHQQRLGRYFCRLKTTSFTRAIAALEELVN
jgi:mRNA-degrading endonuclease toxin of MazEF toxin-antitoxin module